MLAGMRITWVALATLLIALLAGCGGGGTRSTTSTGGEELSKSELIAKGDAICKDAHDRFAELQGSPPTTPEESATFTQGLIDITESEISQLRALNAPASVKPALDNYLKAWTRTSRSSSRASRRPRTRGGSDTETARMDIS